ncbi:tRNA (adenosine(37)-N6)-threonylcarbamoyltransferase complex transferase subunit TsaD, partial [Fulvivirga sp. RKSG066]|uniref:tRNA (adenosine(37)-N6)-threonylcarbamoyltransferase complex dimerization subunit type 1 TsaB n=1 Tax=Fulvivirga aurantia TaxID=2529383 RepID=UPI0012BBB973
MKPTILAIESSCDETSAAIIKNGKVLNNIIATQSVHKKYGGVVPELASRAHQQNIVPVVNQALDNAKLSKNDLDAVAFTQGPGLLGALLVGASYAKGLALGLDIPLIGVNHMQAHILAHFIDDPKPNFPFLCLTVSGGHTQIVIVKDYLDMEIIGETQDDAVGEAFDKSAKLLDLPYPGGPLIDKYAADGNPTAYEFPDSSMP